MSDVKNGVNIRYPLKDLRDYIIAFSRNDLEQRIVVVNSTDNKRVQLKALIATTIATNYPEVAKLVINGNIEEAEKLLDKMLGDKSTNQSGTNIQKNTQKKSWSRELEGTARNIRFTLETKGKNLSQDTKNFLVTLLLNGYQAIPEFKSAIEQEIIQPNGTRIVKSKLMQVIDMFIQEVDISKPENDLAVLQNAFNQVFGISFQDNTQTQQNQSEVIKKANKVIKMIYVNEDILKKGTIEGDATRRILQVQKTIANADFLRAAPQQQEQVTASNNNAVNALLQQVKQQQQSSNKNNLFVENFQHYITNDRLQREVPIFLHFGVPPQEDLEAVKHVNISSRLTDMQFFFTVITHDMTAMNSLIDKTNCGGVVRKVINDPFISKEEAEYFGIKHWFPGLTYADLTAKEVQESLELGNYSIPIQMIEEKFLSQGNHSAVKITSSKDINTQELHNQFPGITKSLVDKKVIDVPDRKGICLVGVPGTGKSTFAKVLAKETNALLIEVDLSNLLHSLVGESEKAADKLFSFLSIVQPAIIFFDEIDKILRNSGTRDGGVSDNIKAKFLKWLDEPKEGQYVIAAANHPEMLAGELTRTGRWDSVYKVLPPPRSIREELVKRYSELYNLPYVKELVDGGEVSNGIDTKYINADLITHSDIATFYKVLRDDLAVGRSDVDFVVQDILTDFSFNYYQDSWMNTYEVINNLSVPSIYKIENRYRRQYQMQPLFEATGEVRQQNTARAVFDIDL